MDLNTITEIARPRRAPNCRRGEPATPGSPAALGCSPSRKRPSAGSSILPTSAGRRWRSTSKACASRRPARSPNWTAMTFPPDWTAAPLFNQCCRSFLASFKIWNTATVGGNICMALPAGPMISLTAALDGVCTIWTPDGGERRVAVIGFCAGAAAQCAGAGRIASAHRFAAFGAAPAHGLSPDFAEPARPLGALADRNACLRTTAISP